ncbi:MAG: T9SS type A sorting domain-containing protein, partial [Candidatus Marinimicrobia bacterium]|nr:T9SS type A sorting domain-containing protein [Candidatus Neomarinimicrobiota bacterium]
IYSQHAANEFLLNPLDDLTAAGRAAGHYVRDALAMGHKMGILASSDGHYGYPGNGWMWAATALDSTSRGTGLTGIYADTLTRESLFAALEDRRVFATTDHRTIVKFKVNGEWMGSEIQSDSIPLISGSVLSHTPIKGVEIIKFDGLIYHIIPLDFEGGSSSMNFSYRDSSYVRSSFYYLRVISFGNWNDRFAWSSPVWVNKPVSTELVELPSTIEYGYFSESDSAYINEIGYSFRSDNVPFTAGETISFEAYNIRKSNAVSVFVNGIFLSYLNTTDENSWGTVKSLIIPMNLVDSVNVIRFENTDALLNNEISEWGVRNIEPSSPIIGISPGGTSVIRSYELKQNFPNPFNPITTIEYSLETRSDISLIIFNLNGQEVARLVDEEKGAGKHSVKWDASDLASGIYFYRLQANPTSVLRAGNFVRTKKMVLLK